jgi:hypothetical protein
MTQWQLTKIGEKMTLNKTLTLLLALAILTIFTTSKLHASWGDLGLVQTVVTYDKELYSVGDEMTVTIDVQLDTEKNHRDMKCYIPNLTTLEALYDEKRIYPELKAVYIPDDLMLSNANPTAQLTYKFMLTKKIATGSENKIKYGKHISFPLSVYMINPRDDIDLTNTDHLCMYSRGIYLRFNFKELIYQGFPSKAQPREKILFKGNTSSEN